MGHLANHVKFGMNPEVTSHIVFGNDSRSPLGQIKMAGVLRNDKGTPERRVFGYYAVVYVTKGQGRFRDDSGFSCPLVPGDLLVLFPEIGHSYGPPGDNYWNETFVVFEGKIFDLWRAQGLLQPQRPLYHLEPIDYWHKRITSTVWMHTKPGRDAALARLCRFQQLLADIFVQDGQLSNDEDEDDWLKRALELLRADLTEPVDYPTLTASLNMSYENFRRRFARQAGVSPGKYRIQQRMQLACEMLVHKSVTVKQVSQELGFFDEFHFSKQFKKIIGMTPSKFYKLFR